MVLVLIIFLIITLVILFSLYAYFVAFFAPQSKRNSIDTPLEGEQYEAVAGYIQQIGHIMEKIPCEVVQIVSGDGYMLYGRYYHVRDGAPIEIQFHGYRSCAFRDCSGAHALSRKMGFNALVVDQRAHGSSDGRTISFGIAERNDCIDWIQYCNSRFGEQTKIILFGLSMGAATVLMASGINLPNNVSCIIADSPYSAPCAIIEKVCSDLHYPFLLFKPFIILGARLFGHFDLNGCSATEAVKTSKIPILLIHGEDDRLVPVTMSYEIATCGSSNVTVCTFPDAGHGLSYLTDPIRYERVIYEFLISCSDISTEISGDFTSRYLEQQT